MVEVLYSNLDVFLQETAENLDQIVARTIRVESQIRSTCNPALVGVYGTISWLGGIGVRKLEVYLGSMLSAQLEAGVDSPSIAWEKIQSQIKLFCETHALVCKGGVFFVRC